MTKHAGTELNTLFGFIIPIIAVEVVPPLALNFNWSLSEVFGRELSVALQPRPEFLLIQTIHDLGEAIPLE